MDNQNQPLQSIPSDPAPINRDNNAQGFYRKTNWKFIAIVVAVGFVISGGLFLLNLFLNSEKTQSVIDVFNQSGQPLQSVILKQGNKTQVVIPKSTTQQNPNSILTHDNSPCAFESLVYDYYLDTYIVKKGDTLLSISKSQSGSTSRVNELVQLNQEKYPSLSIANPFIEIGWQLFLPPKFQKSSTGKLFGLKGRIVDQNQSAFQIGTSSSIPVGSMGILAFKKDTTKYFGKDKFEVGDCVTIVFDDHSITLAISPQDKNYFKEAQEIDTSTWQTYRNSEFGFEVKYPLSWLFNARVEYGGIPSLDIDISNFQADDAPGCEVGYIGLEIQIGGGRKYGRNEEDFETFVHSYMQTERELGMPSGKIEKMQTANYVGFRIEDSGWDSGCKGHGYLIDQGQQRYVYVFTGRQDIKDQIYIDQILSTFRFVKPIGK